MVYTLKLTQTDAYLKSALFIAANILLPYLFHLIPGGGIMFLPIYFFTLVAAQRYGYQVALLTAVMTPIVGNLLSGAPAAAMIPDMLFKGASLAICGYFMAHKLENKFLASFAAVVTAWAFVGLVELPFMGAAYAFQDFVTGLPGMAMMILGSWLINKYVK